MKKLINNFSILTILFCLSFSASAIANTETNLPQPPQTGEPEQESSPGGTRDLATGCSRSITHLLGDNLREYTVSERPIFWFYLDRREGEIENLQFILSQHDNQQIVYNTTIDVPEKVGILGIALPQEPKYALKPAIDYSWQLKINCTPKNNDLATAETNSTVKKGWVRRLAIDDSLQSQLEDSTIPEYEAYLEHNILYDALTSLAQSHRTQPNEPKIKAAWQQLLSDLGWKEVCIPTIVEPKTLYSSN